MDKLREQISHFKPLVQKVLASSEAGYVFTSRDYDLWLVQSGQPTKAIKNYVDEIVFRLHAAALVTLRRNLSWITSIETCHLNSNLFGFCASLRGLIESAADSFYSMRYVPQNLATYFNALKSFMEEEKSHDIRAFKKPFKKLEDWGLHFMEAGKYEDKTLNEEHFRAKSTWEYLKAIDSEEVLKPVYPLYQKLCQITHPSRDTTYLFFHETDEHVWCVSDIDEKFEISKVLQSHNAVYEEVFQKSFNNALILLWIIDRLNIEGLRCPQIRSIDFTGIGEFNKVKKFI